MTAQDEKYLKELLAYKEGVENTIEERMRATRKAKEKLLKCRDMFKNLMDFVKKSGFAGGTLMAKSPMLDEDLTDFSAQKIDHFSEGFEGEKTAKKKRRLSRIVTKRGRI